MIAYIILVASGTMIVYTYFGYRQLLRLLKRMWGARAASEGLRRHKADDFPGVTVYFPALNEEKVIEARIRNIVDQEYPADRVEIFVISDGSSDGTGDRVRDCIAQFPNRRIRLIEFGENRGRSAAQNIVAAEATFDILVGTDAETEFFPHFLRNIVRPFANPNVGVVGGIMRYRETKSELSQSYIAYRSVEYDIRRLEQAAGIMVKTDGACTAYRKSIWREIEEFEDLDHVIVLFARKDNLRAVQADNAVCLETPNSRWRQEVQARSRMTRKGLFAIHQRWRLNDILRDPLFSFALYSHRHARYFSPLYLVGLVMSVVWISFAHGLLAPMLTLILLVLGFGAIAHFTGVNFVRWLIQRIGSFLLANLGFAGGIIGWLSGNRRGRYPPARTLR